MHVLSVHGYNWGLISVSCPSPRMGRLFYRLTCFVLNRYRLDSNFSMWHCIGILCFQYLTTCLHMQTLYTSVIGFWPYRMWVKRCAMWYLVSTPLQTNQSGNENRWYLPPSIWFLDEAPAAANLANTIMTRGRLTSRRCGHETRLTSNGILYSLSISQSAGQRVKQSGFQLSIFLSHGNSPSLGQSMIMTHSNYQRECRTSA